MAVAAASGQHGTATKSSREKMPANEPDTSLA
jgi:hypothetical protein